MPSFLDGRCSRYYPTSHRYSSKLDNVCLSDCCGMHVSYCVQYMSLTGFHLTVSTLVSCYAVHITRPSGIHICSHTTLFVLIPTCVVNKEGCFLPGPWCGKRADTGLSRGFLRAELCAFIVFLVELRVMSHHMFPPSAKQQR